MARLSGMQRLMEVGMIVSAGFALFLFLSVATFNSADPGWSQTGFSSDVRNAAGPAGAWIADVLFWCFGYLAWVIPFATAFVGWFIFQTSKSVYELDYLTIGLRLIGAISLLIGLTGILSINVDDMVTVTSGGMIGEAISHALIPFFSLVGTNLLLLCFVCTGFTLLTGISWLTIIDGLGFYSVWSYKKITQVPLLLGFDGSSSPRLTDKSKDKQLATSRASSHNIEITSMRPEPELDDDQNQEVVQEDYDVPERKEDKFEARKSADEKSHSFSAITNLFKPKPVTVEVVSEEVTERKEPTITNDTRAQDAPKEAKATPAAEPKEATKAAVTVGVPGARPLKTFKELEDVPEGIVPSFDLLDRPNKKQNPISEEELEQIARLVEAKLADFNVEARVVGVFPGPVITRFELDLAPGVKVSKITGLAKDLARAMSAMSVRVVEVIPGKSVIGLELPNKTRETVFLSEVIGGPKFQSNPSNLTMVLGADISGNPVVVDLAKMPHLLVAGTTGSGKSVGVNVMILSLLYKSTPEDVRFIMIDPKMLELSVYEGIPHLLAEVVTDMKEASNALRWCVGEMERRYRLMSAMGVRNLKGYNAKVMKAKEQGTPIKDPLWSSEQSMDEEAPELEKLPSIVVVVDEFADMMMIVGKKVEELIARIAQKARAAGIHLILATQRPSVDVITGLIKANIPTRIAFQVSSKIDSRTILDQQGAEALLGMGDMLYLPPGTGVPTRVHGAFVDDHEVHAVVGDWKKRGEPEYIDEILNGEASADVMLPGEQAENEDQEYDAFYDEAVAFVTESRRASVSGVQRKFRIGYNRAARLVEQMEQNGVVSPPGHNGNRDVLAAPPPKD
ncbi:DNA translocase FtsK [Planctobacterium marinum]|uniref:DNA translocase FtsK n=1 Tax=Planctobacterium marinum TaxID=1631968 RepID=UPI001E3C210E|nr:DNA translocase FtsK [Planctobacterium marinum]MCC2604120.1 DNA translocase FtsK 4TM domain-containing protein [Planctobacterium marinum]